MKNIVIGYCPICKDKLFVKTLRCNSCETELSGEFILSPFDYLSKEQKDFALIFIMCEGNIKEIEKKLNISYPTVKKNIDELKKSLGMNDNILLDPKDIEVKETNDSSLRDEVKRKLKSGEIDFDEAERLLGGNL